MNRLFNSILLFVLVFPLFAAVTDGGADTRILSNMLIELKKENAGIVKQLTEIKATSDTMFTVRDTLADIKAEADFWAEFNPDAELNNILQKYDDITGLDELVNAGSWEQKFNILQNEVGKRFKRRAEEAKDNDPDAENDIKKSLAKIQLLKTQSVKQLVQSAENGSAGLREKDYNARNTTANQLTSNYLAEERADLLRDELRKRKKITNDITFDSDLTTFMKGDDVNKGGLVDFIVNVFDPKVIYENFAYLAGIGAFFPWFLVLFFMVRFLRESSDALIGKSQLADMILSMNKMVIFFAVYSVAGILLFAIMLGFTHLFERFGSMTRLYEQMTSLKNELFSDSDSVKSFFTQVTEYVIDIANLPNAGLTFLIHTTTSTAFLIVNQMLKILYACALALIYAWGFIAITTMMLKNDLKLIEGWKINIATLFIWPIIEAIFLGIWSFVTFGAAAYIKTNYSGSGFGSTSLVMYYLYSTVVLGGAMLIKILSPFIATKLVHNQSIGSTLGAPAAMLGAFTMQKIINASGKKLGESASLPNKEGIRKRDAVARALSNTANKTVGDVIKSARKIGMGNISNN